MAVNTEFGCGIVREITREEDYAVDRLLEKAVVGFKILAWAAAILGTVNGLFVLTTSNDYPSWGGLIIIISGLLYFFVFFVLSHAIKLLLELKKEVRRHKR